MANLSSVKRNMPKIFNQVFYGLVEGEFHCENYEISSTAIKN
jgi:hypothetical protein